MTEEEIAMRKQLAAMEARLNKLEAIGSPEYQQNLRTRYQENGNWARPFLVGLGLGIVPLLIVIALVLGRHFPLASGPGPGTRPAPPPFSLTNVDSRLLQNAEREWSFWATEEPVPRAWGTIVSAAQIDHSTTLYPGTRVQLVWPQGRYYYVVRYQGATYELPNWQVCAW